MRMPWGKFRGQDIGDVPSSYLAWLVEECDLRPALATAVRAELADRFAEPCLACRLRAQQPPSRLPAGLIDSWYRQLCLRWHPDRGGSTAAMQAVGDAYDLLRHLAAETRGYGS